MPAFAINLYPFPPDCSLMPSLSATIAIARLNPTISSLDAFALKSLTSVYSPFGIISAWEGACGLISSKDRA